MGGLLLVLVLAAAAAHARTRGAMSGRRLPIGPEVPAVRGPWAALPKAERLRAYARDLAAAYLAAGLPEVAVPLAVAHSMFATGAWKPDGPKVWNNNIAVVRAGPRWAGPWYRKDTWEVTDDRGTVDPSDDIVMTDRGAPWRSYPSLVAGARATLRIWAQRRYARAYAVLRAGDPSWSRLLGEAGYYTANPRHFERQYRLRLAKVRALLAD